jgi:acyl-CoA synthetase (AMP-forming)/AMP-acid ligase II
VQDFLSKLEAACHANPGRIAIRLNQQAVSFERLWQQVELVAANAAAMGFAPGQTFLFVAQPGPATMPVALGLLKAGLRLAFIDPFTAVESFQTRVAMVKPDLVIADAKLYLLGHGRSAALRKLLKLNVVNYAAIPGARHFVSGLHLPGRPRGAGRIEEFLAEGKSVAANPGGGQPAIDVNADAVVVFTSGTTGDPKGVVHSLRSLSASFDATAEAFDFRAGESLLCEPMTVGLVAMCRGVTWIIPGKELPAEFDKFFGVPTDVVKLLDQLEGREDAASSLMLIGMGGAPVLPSLIRRIHKVVGANVTTLCVYGMTEILPAAITTGEEKLANIDADVLGVPVPGVEVSFADDKEILIRGAGLMKGYLGKPKVDWHATGDLGYLDERGRVMLLGRKKNMLIRADMNIYPSLYEPGLCTIPGVADAVIVGAPDEIGDDRVVLFVVPAESGGGESVARSDLLSRVWAAVPQHMDQQAFPDKIAILDELPVSGRGQKRDMRKLQEMALALFDEAG